MERGLKEDIFSIVYGQLAETSGEDGQTALHWIGTFEEALEGFMGKSATAVVMYNLGKYRASRLLDLRAVRPARENLEALNNILRILEREGLAEVKNLQKAEDGGEVVIESKIDQEEHKIAPGSFYIKGFVEKFLESILDRKAVMKIDVNGRSVRLAWREAPA